MLEGRHVRIDVAGELLALEGEGIDHRQADRVRGSVTFAHHGGIIAVQVVDRNVGKGTEGSEDEAFAAVCKLEVVVGDGIGGVHAHLQPGLHLGVDVGTDAETVEVGADHRTLLVHVGTGDIVLDLFVTALGAQLVLVLERGAEHLVLPVGTDTEDGRIGIIGIVAGLADLHEVIVEFRPLAEVEHVDAHVLLAHRRHAVIGDLGLAGLTVLGGDQDHTVRALGAIDGRSGSVLEDFHADDIGRVEGSQRGDRGNLTVAQTAETVIPAGRTAALDDDTVNDVKRFGTGVDRRLAADADGGAGTRGTGGLHRGDTGGAALQGLVQVGDDGPLEVFFLHGYGSTGEVAPLHGTVTHDDDFVEEFGVFLQEDIDRGLVAHLDLLRCIADGREHECRTGLHRDHIVSIQVCDGTVLGAFLHYGDSDDRADIVADGTGDPVLGEQGPCGHKEHEQGG